MKTPDWLPRLRFLQTPEHADRDSFAMLSLLYLGLLFMPVTWGEPGRAWLWATLASLPVFVAVYLHQLRKRSPSMLLVLVSALLCYVLQPLNPFANTYLAYGAAFAPWVVPGLLQPLLITAALLAGLAIEVLLLHQPPLIIGISVVVCTVCCVANAFAREKRSKDAALRLSQEEVRRLAAIAERERIGRDLHDLLGHTLSLVAIKGELAGRLVGRDPAAAEREIAEVTQIARDALAQVRTAVAGMRAAALAGELAAARTLLESAGVELSCRQDAAELPAPVETALAMIVREAATNIQRHAGATRASVEIRSDAPGERGAAAVALCVSDNGRGGIGVRGNGLAGIGERVRALGGTLEIDSPRGAGTVLRARLPVNP